MMTLERRSRPARACSRERAGRPNRRRRPVPARFAAAAFSMPQARPREPRGLASLVAGLVMAGILAGALWQPKDAEKAREDDVFMMEEEAPAPLPPPPPPPPVALPPPMPEPPPPQVEPPEPPPAPRFGLEEDELAETGGLAANAGNTLMKEAEPEAAPPPPPLPPAPVFMDHAARILGGNPPRYPDRALDRGLEGTVVVLFSIDTAGIVLGATIEKSAGPDFDQAALKSARSMRFEAPVRNGRKAPARFRAPIDFKLE